MPPNSTLLAQEGAQFMSFKIVEKGQFKEQGKEDSTMDLKLYFAVRCRIDRSFECT